MKYSLAILNFLEEITSLSHSIVFLYFFSFITDEGFLSLLAILCNSAFKWIHLFFSPLPFTSPLFSAICKASSDNHFAFLHFFFFRWFWSLPPVQCHEPPSIVLQALCPSDIIPWIYLSLLLYNHKGFDLGQPEWSSGFPYFLQFKAEFGNKEFIIWATVSSQFCFVLFCFADCIELLHLWLQRI